MLKSFFNQGSTDKASTDAATELLHVLADSFSKEERCTAAINLKTLISDIPSSKSVISSYGLEILCNTARNDSSDEAILRNCLECMYLLLDSTSGQSLKEARVNAEQLARVQGAIPLLFDALEYKGESGEQVFHIKYFSIQILKSLFDTNHLFVQQASSRLTNYLTAPVGLLHDQEVLRNDAIVLLQFIVYQSKYAQDLAWKTGCLEQVFSIYENADETFAAVQEDSLLLMRYILEDNIESQAFFDSSKMLSKVLNSIERKSSRIRNGSKMSPEDSKVLARELGILMPFLQSQRMPEEIRMLANFDQKKSKLVEMLLTFALIIPNLIGDDMSPSSASWECLKVLYCSAYGDDIDQIKIQVENTQVHLAVGALHAGIASSNVFHQLSCSRFYLSCVWSNERLIKESISTIAKIPDRLAVLSKPVGSIHDAMSRSLILLSLSPLCIDQKARETLFAIKFGPRMLVEVCAEVLASAVLKFGTSPEIQDVCMNCSIFLAAASINYTPAIEIFLHSIRDKPFLIGVLLSENQFGESEKLMKASCALLLGLALKASSTCTVNPKVLEGAIKEKIGIDTFIGYLDFLYDASERSECLIKGQRLCFGGTVSFEFLQFTINAAKEHFRPGSQQKATFEVKSRIPSGNSTNSSIVNDIPKLEAGTSQADSLRQTNKELQNLLNQSKEENKSSEEKILRLTADLEALSQAYTALEEHSTELKRRIEKLEQDNNKYLENESAMEDLLVCLGQEEEKVKNLEAEVEKLRMSS